MSSDLTRTMPKAGLDAANVAKKSQSFTPCVRHSLTQALTFGFLLFLRRSLPGLLCRRLLACLAWHPIRFVDLTATADRERAGRYIVCDHRARANIGVV